MAVASVPAGDLVFTQGEERLRRFQSSEFGRRRHCADCGWFETADALPRHDRFRPDTRGLEGTEPPG